MKARFEQEVGSLRDDKDSFFRNDVDSPIPPGERSSFKGLNYFQPNEIYRVASRLERFDAPKPIMMATSNGEPTSIRQVWQAGFQDWRKRSN